MTTSADAGIIKLTEQLAGPFALAGLTASSAISAVTLSRALLPRGAGEFVAVICLVGGTGFILVTMVDSTRPVPSLKKVTDAALGGTVWPILGTMIIGPVLAGVGYTVGQTMRVSPRALSELGLMAGNTIGLGCGLRYVDLRRKGLA